MKGQKLLKQQQRQQANHNNTKLKILYIIVTILCLFMIMWILIFPSSWLMGHSTKHDQLIHGILIKKYDETLGQVPPKTITKYKGHTLIQFTHILPGCLWVGSIPIQLHSSIRKMHRTFHKIVGYVFIVTSMMIAFGIFLIFQRNLTFHNDYPTTLPPVDTIDVIMMKISSTILTMWFIITAITAVCKARSKDYIKHRRYIIRHIGSGIWIILQRIIVVFCQAFNIVKNPIQMRNLFGNAATGSIFITLILSEYTIWLLENNNKHDQNKKNKVL